MTTPDPRWLPNSVDDCETHWLTDAIASGKVPTLAEVSIAFSAAHAAYMRRCQEHREATNSWSDFERHPAYGIYFHLRELVTGAAAELNRQHADALTGPDLSWEQVLQWGRTYDQKPSMHHYGLPVSWSVGSLSWLSSAVAAGYVPTWRCLEAALGAMRIFERDFHLHLGSTDSDDAHLEYVLGETEACLSLLTEIREDVMSKLVTGRDGQAPSSG